METPTLMMEDHPGQGESQQSGFFEDRELPVEQANPTPDSVVDTASQVSDFLGSYGWYIILAIIGVYYLKTRFHSRIQGWQKRNEQESDLQRYDETTVLSRQEGMDRARQKMQDAHNARADEHIARTQEREEEKRKQELEDWQNHKEGKGYKSKLKNRTQESLASPGAEGGESRPRKKLIRDNYNPLMGAGGGSAFRAPRRGGSGGG